MYKRIFFICAAVLDNKYIINSGDFIYRLHLRYDWFYSHSFAFDKNNFWITRYIKSDDMMCVWIASGPDTD